jgi:hypothetical protein
VKKKKLPRVAELKAHLSYLKKQEFHLAVQSNKVDVFSDKWGPILDILV